jgi:hypothetical protein
MGSRTCFHANQIDAEIRSELQQLSAGALLAHHSFAPQVQAN